jgi:hypothetical protein
MNGRVYDPVLGRFLSPDPLVQAPYDTQGLNRYAYVRNNPMRYVDPSGLCFNQHAPTDGIEQNCLEVILVEGSGVWSGDRPARQSWGDSSPFRPRTDAAQHAGTPSPTEENEGIAEPANDSTANSDYFNAQVARWNHLLEKLTSWQYFDETVMFVGSLMAAIEPTPYGEYAMATFAMGTFGRRAITSIAYGPMNPGPLSAGIAATFRGGAYREVVYDRSIQLYRVYGGRAGQLGSYWTATPPTGMLRSRIDLALMPQWGNSASLVVRINVPAGTRMYEGYAASQGGLVGGGTQVFVPNVNPAWILK